MSNAFTVNVTQWQGIDNTAVYKSKNIIESGAVEDVKLEIVGGHNSVNISMGVQHTGYEYRLNSVELVAGDSIYYDPIDITYIGIITLHWDGAGPSSGRACLITDDYGNIIDQKRESDGYQSEDGSCNIILYNNGEATKLYVSRYPTSTNFSVTTVLNINGIIGDDEETIDYSSTATLQKYVSSTSGAVNNSETCRATDFIPVNAGDIVTITSKVNEGTPLWWFENTFTNGHPISGGMEVSDKTIAIQEDGFVVAWYKTTLTSGLSLVVKYLNRGSLTKKVYENRELIGQKEILGNYYFNKSTDDGGYISPDSGSRNGGSTGFVVSPFIHVNAGDTVHCDTTVGGNNYAVFLYQTAEDPSTSGINGIGLGAQINNTFVEQDVIIPNDGYIRIQSRDSYLCSFYISRATGNIPQLLEDVKDLKSNRGQIVKYVKLSGNDSNFGNDPNSPYATIQKAINESANLILVERGIYHENLQINGKTNMTIMPLSHITNIDNINIEPKIIIDKIVVSNSRNVSFYEIHCNMNSVNQYWVDETNDTSYTGKPWYISDSDNIYCKSCWASEGAEGGFMLSKSNAKFDNCKAWNIGSPTWYNADGFNIGGYGLTEFIDCVAYNCYDDGNSNHSNSETIIRGGEYYNCKSGGGVAPTGNSAIVDSVYVHNCNRGLEFGAGQPQRVLVSNSVFLDNNNDVFVTITSTSVKAYNIKYDESTKYIGEGATFIEL